MGVENNRMRCPMGSIAFGVLRTTVEMMSRIIDFIKLVCVCVCVQIFGTCIQKRLADLRVDVQVDCDCN